MTESPRCENCKFYFTEGGATLCRRNPPMVVPVPDPKTPLKPSILLQSQFPVMQPIGWCGEHVRKVGFSKSDSLFLLIAILVGILAMGALAVLAAS